MSDHPALTGLFAGLHALAPDAGPALSAVPIPWLREHRLGRDARGNACLLLNVSDSERKPDYSIQLENLAIQQNVLCEIVHVDGTTERAIFTVITCQSSEPELRDYFLRIAEPVVQLIGVRPSQAKVREMIESLVRLFRAVAETPQESAQGLWAEMFVIAQARHPAVLASAWRVTPRDCFDFNAGACRLEVKSNASRRREHYFSFEQVRPPEGTSAIIASLFVESAGAGLSVDELLLKIRDRLAHDPALTLRVYEVVTATLGAGLRQGFEQRFDQELAKNSLQFYDAANIPTVCESLPQRISEVRFKADLSDSTPLASDRMQASALYRAARAAR